ncbi:MAG: tetratricopeptide repeat protein [Myxococcaceae bacterium]
MNSAEALATLLEYVRDAEREGDLVRAHGLLDGADDPLRHMGCWHFTRGALAFRSGDVSRAIDAFERAVALEPELAEFHANLGAALFERARRSGALESGAQGSRDLSRALEVLEKAVTLSPKLPSVFNNLGLVRAACGHFEGALDAYDRALQLDASNANALYNRAAALHRLGCEEDCLACLDLLLQRHPDFAPAKASRENTLRRLGR